MHFGIGMGVTQPVTGGSALALGINANAWQITLASPAASYSPVASPVTISVTRNGFDTSANPTTFVDTLTLMRRTENPFPNQATNDANNVALSDFVYTGETVTGHTNRSTWAAPLPIACWLTEDRGRARGTNYTVRLAVAHAYARNGTPVAAVRFSASDGTNSVTQLVSTMSSRAYASGLSAPYYEWSIPLASLNQAAIITVDATIYPWVGAAYTISTNGNTYPSINLTTLSFLNDRTGGYGEAYAYVSTTGNDGTAVTSATAATAQASPYATISAAVAGVRTFNNANYGRNDASGGTVRLEAGTYNMTAFQAQTTAIIPVVIEAANVANKATTIITSDGTNRVNTLPAKVKFKDLTLQKAGASVTLFDSNATLASLTNQLILENVTINQNGTSAYGAWFWKVGRMFMHEVNCTTNISGMFDSFSGACKEITAVGCSGPWLGNQVYNIVAGKHRGCFFRVVSGAQTEQGNGQLIAHSFVTQTTNGSQAMNTDATGIIDARGFAAVYTVFESTGDTAGACVRIGGDGDVTAEQNVLLQGCTIVGERANVMYQDVGSTRVEKRWYMQYSVLNARNTKSHVFGANGNLVGNFPALYNVGARNNCAVRGASDGNGIGVGNWLGSIAALGDLYGTTASPVAVNWTVDASFTGTAAGDGNYRPGVGSALPVIPAGMAQYPIDHNGTAISNTGTAKIGALQP